MLEKIKNLKAHVTGKANDAVEGFNISVKQGVESITSTAGSVTDAINEKAVRSSTAQMCSILEIAMAELKTRPLSEQPVSLTTTVNFGIATLEMQINLQTNAKTNGSDTESTSVSKPSV